MLRHSLATSLLRQGGSLDEIGELLRHQSPNTTAIYAKVDVTALHTLALPWPRRRPMTQLRKAVRDYLTMRRCLGFKLVSSLRPSCRTSCPSWRENAVPRITVNLALEWATQNANHKPYEWAARLSIVRGFARHWSATDPSTEVPPLGLLPYRPPRAQPYLYSDHEIRKLLKSPRIDLPLTLCDPGPTTACWDTGGHGPAAR